MSRPHYALRDQQHGVEAVHLRVVILMAQTEEMLDPTQRHTILVQGADCPSEALTNGRISRRAPWNSLRKERGRSESQLYAPLMGVALELRYNLSKSEIRQSGLRAFACQPYHAILEGNLVYLSSFSCLTRSISHQ